MPKPNPSFSEKHLVDSLLHRVIEARNQMPDSVILFSDRVIEYSRAIGYRQGELQGIFQKATGHFIQSRYDKAEEECRILFEELNSTDLSDTLFFNKLTGSAYILQGVLEQRQGNYEVAVSHQLKALTYLEKIKDEENMANAYSNLSENFRLIKDFEKSLSYNKKAEFFFEKTNAKWKLPMVMLNRGNIFFDQKKYTAALEFFEVALKHASEINDFGVAINAINNIGTSYEEMRAYDLALEYYHTALEQYLERKDYWGAANTMGNISMVHLGLREFKKAKAYSNEALQLSKKQGFLELEKFNMENLSKILEAAGDIQGGFSLYKQAQIIQDSLYNQQKFEAVSRLEKQFNEERSNRIIAQKDRDLTAAQLHSQRLQSFAVILGMFLIAVLLGAWLLYRQARIRKARNQELLLKNSIIQHQKEDLESLLSAFESQREKYIDIGNRKIQLDQIIYIRYQNRVSFLFLDDGSIVEHRIQLSELIAELTYKSYFLFAQINQNYIVHFKNVDINYQEDENEKYYYTHFLPHDRDEYRTEPYIKTRIRSGLTKKFDREYQRYLRLQEFLH